MKKSFFVGVRLDIDEYEILKDRAKRAYRSLSTYVREVALGNVLHEKPQDEFLKALWTLDRMETNLKKIEEKARIYGYIDKNEIKETIKKINNFRDDLSKRFLY